MSVDMTKWQEIAKANIHNRPAGEGRLAGKITIVTGAAQGFGKGIAEELYNEGATIVIADMNQPLAEQVAAEMGERACAIAVNVSDEESVANLVAQTVEKLKEAGVWTFAAEAGGTDYYETDFDLPCAIVLGSEGAGVGRLVKETCDFIVSIPMYGKVNSLNVSTAASVLLCHAARCQRVKK